MKKKFTLLFLMMACLTAILYGQERTIRGKVVSLEEGSELPGVSVLVKGTTTGTVTDVDGNYSLAVSENAETLVFSYIGFASKEVSIAGRTVIDVQLETDITQLSEVVVTALGVEVEKRALGYAVEELNSEEITRTKQNNLVSAMQGKVSGVQITNSGGAPGMSSRIVIRGLSSFTGDNQPLFVVDGIPISNSTTESTGTPRGMTNRAADINPEDIESISVLKGGAATALYGIDAANGAVIITTKSGKRGKVTLNVKSTMGFDEINRYPDFQEKYGQGFSGNFDSTSFWPSWGAPVEAVQTFVPSHQYYDNSRNTMQTGTLFDNYISMSGGGENSTFYISFSDTQQKGVIPNSDWGRTSAKVNGSIKMHQKFKMSASTMFSRTGGNRVPHDRIMERLMYWANTQDATDYINPDGTQRTYGNTNPLYDAEFATYEDQVNRFIGNISLNYQPLDWLNVLYRFGLDYYNDSRTDISPGPQGIPGEAVLNGSRGFIGLSSTNGQTLNSLLSITINKDITDRFNANLQIGNDVKDIRSEAVSANGGIFNVPGWANINNATDLSNSQSLFERRLIGLYGNLTLSYDDFLYLTVTGRNDWTSTLENDNRSFFYPSVSVGFVFHDVLNLPDMVTFAKFRSSFAKVGKDAPPYRTSVVFIPGDPVNGQLPLSQSSNYGDPLLKPELSNTFELGLEMDFLENRLGFDVTYYNITSTDQIFDVPVSNATGFTRVFTNAGELQNKGIELLLHGTPIRTPDFTWDVTLNFTRNRNTVVDIYDGIEDIYVGGQFGYAGSSVSMIIERDAPYGNLYGTSYQRYYENGQPEDLKYLDHDRPKVIGPDGYPVINSDQLVIGNSQPDWLAGVSNTFTYKGLSLSFLVDMRYGIDQFSQFDNFYSAFGKLEYSNNRNEVVIFDGVMEDGTPNTTPVWLGQGLGPDLGDGYVNGGAGFYRNHFRGASENFVQDASFIKLRNITLSYDLPASLIGNTPFERINLSGSVNNIILWTPWTGYDPESFSAGAGSNATAFTGLGYPGTRSYLFTLNLTL